jgi:hypothetical protein
MTLRQWAENGWLKPHKTSSIEISNLLKIVDRDLIDAGGIHPCATNPDILCASNRTIDNYR